jgi:hypothetical protein
LAPVHFTNFSIAVSKNFKFKRASKVSR